MEVQNDQSITKTQDVLKTQTKTFPFSILRKLSHVRIMKNRRHRKTRTTKNKRQNLCIARSRYFLRLLRPLWPPQKIRKFEKVGRLHPFFFIQNKFFHIFMCTPLTKLSHPTFTEHHLTHIPLEFRAHRSRHIRPSTNNLIWHLIEHFR